MALISQNALQKMFDPMFSEQDQTYAQQQGINLQQNDQIPVVTASSVDDTTTLPPTIPGYKGSYEGKVVGGTKKEEYRIKNLFDVNTKYLADISKKISDLNTEYATTIFQSLQKLPVIDGATVPLSEFSNIFATDKAKAKKLLEQASEFEDDPGLDLETSWNLAINNYNSITLSSKYNLLKNKFDKNVRDVAMNANMTTSNPIERQFGIYELLFDKDGNLRTEKDFRLAVNKKKDQLIAERDKELQNISMLDTGPWMRSDMPVQVPVVDKSGKVIGTRVGSGGTYETSTEAFSNKINSIKSQSALIKKFADNVSYSKVYDDVKKFYNKEKTSSIYIGAEEEAMIKDQKGGDKQTPVGEFDFNFADMKWKDRFGNIVFKPQIKEFITIASILTNPENKAVASVGSVSESIPSTTSQETKTITELLGLIKNDIQQQGEKYKDAEKRHKKSFFAGTIKFQGIVGQDDKYHAFYIKLNDKYLNKDEYSGGTQENPKIVKADPKIKTEGFTIYIPAEISSKRTNAGLKFTEATTISDIESLLNMNNDVSLPFKGAGTIQITKNNDAEGNVTVGGYFVNFNDQTYRYDTVDIQKQVFPYNKTTDIDGYIRQEILPRLQLSYNVNRQIKNWVDQNRGVKDPAKLQQSQQ